MRFAKVEAAIAAIFKGDFVVVADDEGRENEGDLILAASVATPEKIAFMVRHTSGLLCVGARSERLNELALPLMVPENTESHQTAFTVSVDYRHGTSTGISAADRSATISALANPNAPPSDFARPGHVFPLRARPDGVLARPGHTEAACDLAELAGFAPLGALSEIVNDDGSMARRDDLVTFSERHGLVFITIAELVAFRRALASGRAPWPQSLVELKQPSHPKDATGAIPHARPVGMQSA
ncbi:MAG: 3,4-dihydroxy-2-butanone-4-phosphate synthase [Polyangiaceae bacterium]